MIIDPVSDLRQCDPDYTETRELIRFCFLFRSPRWSVDERGTNNNRRKIHTTFVGFYRQPDHPSLRSFFGDSRIVFCTQDIQRCLKTRGLRTTIMHMLSVLRHEAISHLIRKNSPLGKMVVLLIF